MAKQKERSLAVMLSKRANIFYLERAKITQSGEKVVYNTQSEADVESFFNIPDKNTSLLLLGPGTSITNAAVRLLSESNVMIGFCSGGGTPLYASTDITFLPPQDEYRPTEYMQGWASQWFDEGKRIELGRKILRERIKFIETIWPKYGLEISERVLEKFAREIEQSESTQKLLSSEADWARSLYRILSEKEGIDFKRTPGQSNNRDTNAFLDQGNYIAYGLAAVALHGLGISFSFPALHGKTRRGGLVFDIADLIKDAVVMPCAFEHGSKGSKEGSFRADLIERMHDNEVLDEMMKKVKNISADNT